MNPTKMPSTTELRAALEHAEHREQQARLDAESVLPPPSYDWQITWESEHVFHCTRTLTQAYKDLCLAFQAQHGRLPSRIALLGGFDRCEGMSYYLIAGYLASASGGYCILKASPDSPHWTSSKEPRKLTPEEVLSLRSSEVPLSLRA